MQLKHYSEEKLKKEISDIIGTHINLAEYRVFFFGSRVSGKNTDRSDIDVGIEGTKPLPTGVLFDIQDEIDLLPTLYKIEIVDFFRVPAKFREVALQHQEPISLPL